MSYYRNTTAEKLLKKLPTIKTQRWDSKVKDLVDHELNWDDYAIINEDGALCLSAEQDEHCVICIADYYGEAHPKDWPWINPTLEEWAEKHNKFWDWLNPGGIILCDD